MDFVIVTGMSGAGKSQAVDALEDLGYYCVDNVPPVLLSKFAELPQQSGGKISRIALVVDVRSRDMFAEYKACLAELKAGGYQFKTLFLDCDNSILLKRYKETRRKHPLMNDMVTTMSMAIREERELLEAPKHSADFIVDTSLISASQLKNRVRELFSDGVSQSMVVSCMSFGFKHGLPVDADLVFDVRCLPNPYYVEGLREKTGLDAEVRSYVLGFEQAAGLIPRLFDLMDYLIPLYVQEGKSQLVVAVGCTGGKHRSVVFAELLAQHLSGKGSAVTVSHRDVWLANKR